MRGRRSASSSSAIQFAEDDNEQLEVRLIRVEEVMAARWPRRLFLRWRLAREIRASVAGYPDSYIPRGDFEGRRLEAGGHSTADARARRHAIWDERRRAREEDFRRDKANLARMAVERGLLDEAALAEFLRWLADEHRQDGEGGADPGEGFLP